MGAQEYKPKSYGGTGQTVNNPYASNNNIPNNMNMNNMYNPYGGGYSGGNMMNNQIPGQNFMYNSGYYDPNMMNSGMIENNTNQNKVETKPSGGIIGMGGKAKKTGTTAPLTNAPVGLSNQPKVISTSQTVQNTTKPKIAEVKKTTATTGVTGNKKTQNVNSNITTSKPQDKTVITTKEVIEVTEKTEDLNLNSELDINVEDSKEGKMIEIDQVRKPVTIVFIGHVDAGKSTISGTILYKTGQIDERTIDKYKREAKANNRESWFMAYIMDINDEEKERGKTVEVGKAFFSTPNKRFTILDAPGHASFVPNMLQGACQADYAGLVISAKNGEFEAGFEKDGRTKEHALLAKSLGVFRLIVIINKMDEESVKWSQERYEQIKADLSVFLKNCGYNLEKHVFWIPMSALNGDNLVEPVSKHKCTWYNGPTLLELLDSQDLPPRNENGPVRIPLLDRYKDQGVYLLGKIESGTVKYGSTYTLMPSKLIFEVAWLFDTEERGVPYAKPGESVRIKVKGIENESEVARGSVICSNDDLCPVFTTFEAEIQVLEIPEKKQIMANGYQCILHMHTIIEECFIDLIGEIDRKTKTEKKVKFLRSQSRAKVIIKTNNALCGEKFEKFSTLGRFTLRDEGKTIAIGKILRYKPLK